MFIERNEFRLKFGKAKDAIALWKEIMKLMKAKDVKDFRVLTDLTGPSYTLVLESSLEDWKEMDTHRSQWAADPKFHELYQKFIPLCESSTKTFYKVEEEI